MFDLMKAFEVLENVKATTNEMSVSAFGAFYNVLIEEWAKANDFDVLEMADKFHGMLIEVNEEQGAY